MKIILLVITTLLFFQADDNQIKVFNHVDLSDDGKLMVGINETAVYLIDTELFKIVDKYTFVERSNRNPNVRISGNGKHLIFSRGWKFYYAEIKRNRIKIPTELMNKVWLDMEINYNGTEFIATLDRKYIPEKCSPGKRQVVKFWRNENIFERDTLLPDMEDCGFVNHVELLPKGGIIYQFRNPNFKNPNPTIFEAIPDSRSDWGHLPIYSQGDGLVHQAITKNGDFLTYSMKGNDGYCGLYLNKKDANGEWRKTPAILSQGKDCQGSWFTCISPDGTKIAWLKFTRDTDNQPITSDIMISHQLDNETWSTPRVLMADYGLSSQGKSIKDMKLSNTNLTFALWHGPTYLYTTLDENGTLHQIE